MSLDWAMYKSSWFDLYSGVVVCHLACNTSDHYQLLLNTKDGDFS